MPLSTSSFELADYPKIKWCVIWSPAIIILLLVVGLIEYGLYSKGISPSLSDSELAWQYQRARASRTGSNALILVGASRIQLGMDQDMLRTELGMEPVQLAIDGSSPLPVLENLAQDPSVTGTIIVDYYDHYIDSAAIPDETTTRYVKNYTGNLPTLSAGKLLELQLTNKRATLLSAYSDGTKPYDIFVYRLLQANFNMQYLITRADRSRLADYSRVPMPDFYYERVSRTLGKGLDLSGIKNHAEADQTVHRILARYHNGTLALSFKAGTAKIRALVKTIEARGGKVIFVAMPTSRLVREIELAKFPHAVYWRYFWQQFPHQTIHFLDYPALADFDCPDGSHLDYRDRSRFTKTLIPILQASLQQH